MENERTYTTFLGAERVVTGDLVTMLRATSERLREERREGRAAGGGHLEPVILDHETGRPVDFDFRGSAAEVVARAVPAPAPRGPGRPRLGVVAREVTLLPRHWEWLAEQPSGASAALRRLVDEARQREGAAERARRAATVTGRAMTVLAGDRPNFEEAYRALDAADGARFAQLTAGWPESVRGYLLELAAEAFTAA